MNNSKIEAVTVSVNYSDLLEITLEKNIHYFDNIIILTTPEDLDTQKLCKKYEKVFCVTTDAFNYNNAKFNKGLAIDVGFRFLKHQDWIITLDSDIILPSNFRERFLLEAKDKECSYGARRYDIPSFKEWKEIEKDFSKIKNKLLYRGIGYGYFFCFNYQSSTFQDLIKNTGGFPYPNWFQNVAESDWIFRNIWSDWIFDPKLDDSPNQHNIPNNDHASNPEKLKELSFQVIHLGETGKNESSRITPKFNE